jgi:hypothetical protein
MSVECLFSITPPEAGRRGDSTLPNAGSQYPPRRRRRRFNVGRGIVLHTPPCHDEDEGDGEDGESAVEKGPYKL